MNIELNSTGSASVPSKFNQEGQVAGFVLKTFQILQIQDYQKIIYWAPNGLQFIVKDIIKFQEIVLPRYFRHNKMNSFVRQLNMYGFHKIKHNNFKSTFRHEFFQKDKEELLPLIKRKLKVNEKQEECCEETKLPLPVIKIEKPILQIFPKQQEQPTMAHQKWANISQQFLVTTKMINLSLIKVSCNDLSEIANLIPEEDDCVSIEDEISNNQKQEENFFEFQNPSCFFSSRFNI